MKVLLFKDSGFDPMPEYGADDVSGLLRREGIEFSLLGRGALSRGLSRETCDVFVLPYVTGEFAEAELSAMLDFHASGGSMFFLGDIPHRGNWYPLRNSHAYRFHLTRCYDDFNICAERPGIEGLTDDGVRIAGRLLHPEFFAGKRFPGLRVTAFPPDITHPLLRVKSSSHTEISSSVLAVERRCGRFFGAKFAMIGFNGGEPRENADGAYQFEWKRDPGLLTREWRGLDDLVLKLLRWLEPERISADLHVRDILPENPMAPLRVVVRNSGRKAERISASLSCDGRAISKFTATVGPDAVLSRGIRHSFRPGSREYLLDVRCGNGGLKRVSRMERVVSKEDDRPESYGFSSYWAFSGRMPEEMKFFICEMARRGCQYARMNIPWEDIEPEPGRYDWSLTDQLLDFAGEKGIMIYFWLFPTTRGSGLYDGGVPWWSLKEPAMDRYGNKGFFPTIWSEFYRRHYFGMVDELTRRYAKSRSLGKFVIDFGNSDFPYGYYYYGGDNSIFDYSEQERKAFSGYLRDVKSLNLDDVSKLFGGKMGSYGEIRVPYSEEKAAFRVYLEFREWSIRQGIEEINRIVGRNAPGKLPEDLPGHGLGSIADISTYFYEAKAKYWLEEKTFGRRHVAAHNAGRSWGGEPWQVGGDYRQYDEALFQSVRLGAGYFSIPGADLGLYGDDISRIGLIRRSLAGAEREEPRLAVCDRIEWNAFNSLAHVAARLDIPAALIYRRHRYDFSRYGLMVLPPQDHLDRTVTGGGGGQLLPDDEEWYWLLRLAVEKGMNLLVYPGTCEIVKSGLQRTFLRQVFGLEDVRYGKSGRRKIVFKGSFGRGMMEGSCRAVLGGGEELLKGDDGVPLLVARRYGKGSVLLAGFDNSPGSFDSAVNYEEEAFLNDHTLLRIASHCGIVPEDYRTGGLYAYKEKLEKNGREYFLIFSHCRKSVNAHIRIRLKRRCGHAFDLASGEKIPLHGEKAGMHSFRVSLNCREGRYLRFE